MAEEKQFTRGLGKPRPRPSYHLTAMEIKDILTHKFLDDLYFCVSAAEGDGAISESGMKEMHDALSKLAKLLGHPSVPTPI